MILNESSNGIIELISNELFAKCTHHLLFMAFLSNNSLLPFIFGYLHNLPNKTYFIKYYHIGEGRAKGHTYISEEFVCQFIIYLTYAENYRFELLKRIKQDIFIVEFPMPILFHFLVDTL